ncbi:MAG: C-terminal binding protein [Acidobacteria bacterium]|nr:C-terminal binding protein [Acidobacteriota bacterium]
MTSQQGDQPVRVVNVDCDRPDEEKERLYAPERKAVEDLGGELILLSAQTEEEIIRACAGARIILTEGLFTPINRRVLESLPDCWAVGRYGIGVDNIDVEAATDCGIVVFNVADYCVEEVADHAAALVLSCARRVVILDRHVRAGGWDKPPLGHPLRRISRLTLGLVGFGNIGRHMVPRLQGFGMRILATDPYVDPRLAAEAGVELTSLERVLGESDLVSLHTFLAPGTRHLIGAPELGLMKPSAFLVNTSRGGVVDEEALIQALKERRIGGAGLDVTEEEPLGVDSPLRSLDNVVLTPHQGSSSVESGQDLRRGVTEALSCMIQGYLPPFVFNRSVKPRGEFKPRPA